MKRLVILLALLMAVVLVLSAPMAEAKKKKNKKKPTTIYCPTQSNGICTGNSAANLLLDQANAFTYILGGEGNDTYVEYSGSSTSADTLRDDSTTSSDYYYIANKGFNKRSGDALYVLDNGGSIDTLDLSPAGYRSWDCPHSRVGNNLFIGCTGGDDIVVFNYYTTDSIEYFKFTDGTSTGPASSSASAASNSADSQQQSPTQLPEGEHSSELLNQLKDNASSDSDWNLNDQPSSASSGG
jgi:hypothetical protein